MLQASGKSTRSLKVAFVEKMLRKASPQITNPQILGRILLLQSQKFFIKRASPKIANPLTFMINPNSQIHKFLQNTEQLCRKTLLKIVFSKRFFLFCTYKFELEHYRKCYISKEKKYYLCIMSQKKLGSENRYTNYSVQMRKS
jgi:hypothetical protein